MQVRAFHYGWVNVGVGMASMAFAPVIMAFFTLGVYMPVLIAEFDWTRTQVSAASTIGTMSSAVFTPFIGRIVDAVGVKRVIILAVALFSFSFSSLFYLQFSLLHLYIAYFLIGMTAPVTTLCYTRTITAWFEHNRGIALGLTMAGTGIGAAFLPPLAQYLVELFGWRLSYVCLGVIACLVSIPLVLVFLREHPPVAEKLPEHELSADMVAQQRETAKDEYGMSRDMALKSGTLWGLIVIFLLVAISLHAVTIHLVPIIIDTGISPLKAAGFMSIYGSTVIAGRLLCGFSVDHIFAPYVACIIFLLSGLGIYLLSTDPGVATLSIAAALIGLGIGAETDLLGYLVGRYFGLKKFGEIYGFVFSAFMIGTSIGPVFLGMIFDQAGSYEYGLYLLTGLMAVSAVLALRLGNYPDWQAV